ncbi:MAG: ABC transporter permease [Phycisphaerales bacterium]
MNNHDRLTNTIMLTLAGIGLLFIAVPVGSLLVEMPWSRFGEILSNPDLWVAMRISLVVSLSAVVLSLIFGFPIAWIMCRYRSPMIRIVRVIVLMPMVLPPIVGGVALLTAFGINSPIGRVLDHFGIHLPFTTFGAILAATFVSCPFMILTLESGIRKLPKPLEEAALALGSSQWRVFWAVSLPGLMPAIIGGASLTWARALGEFGATIAFAGNRPGYTQTLPLAIYEALQSDMDRAMMIAVLLILITSALMIFVRNHPSADSSGSAS